MITRLYFMFHSKLSLYVLVTSISRERPPTRCTNTSFLRNGFLVWVHTTSHVDKLCPVRFQTSTVLRSSCVFYYLYFCLIENFSWLQVFKKNKDVRASIVTERRGNSTTDTIDYFQFLTCSFLQERRQLFRSFTDRTVKQSRRSFRDLLSW